jgi:hypothetical protein
MGAQLTFPEWDLLTQEAELALAQKLDVPVDRVMSEVKRRLTPAEGRHGRSLREANHVYQAIQSIEDPELREENREKFWRVFFALGGD